MKTVREQASDETVRMEMPRMQKAKGKMGGTMQSAKGIVQNAKWVGQRSHLKRELETSSPAKALVCWRVLALTAVFWLAGIACRPAAAEELIPPLSQIKADHPRLLVRPEPTRFAIAIGQLKSLPRNDEFKTMLRQLQGQDNAAAQAMVWMLTQDPTAAEKAVRRMRNYHYPGKVDTFHIYGRLTEFGLAYDWLYNWPGFGKEVKAEVRADGASEQRCVAE